MTHPSDETRLITIRHLSETDWTALHQGDILTLLRLLDQARAEVELLERALAGDNIDGADLIMENKKLRAKLAELKAAHARLQNRYAATLLNDQSDENAKDIPLLDWLDTCQHPYGGQAAARIRELVAQLEDMGHRMRYEAQIGYQARADRDRWREAAMMWNEAISGRCQIDRGWCVTHQNSDCLVTAARRLHTLAEAGGKT